MIGWAAATGPSRSLSIALFLIIFMWTPPHFWALALFREGDYARAGVRMMPNVAGAQETRKQILLYSLILVPITFLPSLLGTTGMLYTGGDGGPWRRLHSGMPSMSTGSPRAMRPGAPAAACSASRSSISSPSSR